MTIETPDPKNIIKINNKTINRNRLKKKNLNKLRWEAHRYFDKLWQSGLMSRSLAYSNLCRWTGFSRKDAHFSKFTKIECLYVIELLKDFGVTGDKDKRL